MALLRRFAVLVPVAVAALGPTPAVGELWRPLGPPAGQVTRSVAVDPFDSAILYAPASPGLFRGDDRGAHWRLIGDGLPGVAADAIVPAPLERGTLYLLAEGLWKSSDGGAHARRLDLATFPGEALFDLAVDPARPSLLYVVRGSGIIERSRDGGLSWSALGADFEGSYSPHVLGIDPGAPDTLYVGATLLDENEFLDLRIYRSADGGATWTALTAAGQLMQLLPFGLGDIAPRQILVAPGAPAAIYVATDGAGVIRSLDGGATWSLADDGLPFPDDPVVVGRLTLDPSSPSTLYAAVPRRHLSGEGALYKTTDGGDHWALATTGIPDGLPVHQVAVDPSTPSRLYAATDRGVYVSEDAAATWASLAAGMSSDVRALAPDPDAAGTWYAVTGTAGPQRTTDGGATWQPFATGLDPRLRFRALDLAPAACTPGTLFLGTPGIYPSGQEPPEQVVLESTDGGASWRRADTGIESTGISHLLTDAHLCSTVFAFTDGDALYRSSDGAETWSRIFPAFVYSLLVDPEDPSLLYVGTQALLGSTDQGFCRSSDGGATWSCPPTPFGLDPVTSSLAATPASEPVLYAVSGLRSRAVFMSRDRGTTWSATAGRGLPAVPITDLVVDPRDGSSLWAATEGGGVFRSRNGADDWTPLSQGLASGRIDELVFGQGGLRAATAAGVYLLDESAGAGDPTPPDGLPWIADATYPGFRFKVRIGQGSAPPISGRREPACLPETVCLSGAVPGRSELFLRIVGPKPNGWLWPTLVKFSTSEVEVWIQQLETGRLRYYDLRGASPGVDQLPGLFDRFGFLP